MDMLRFINKPLVDIVKRIHLIGRPNQCGPDMYICPCCLKSTSLIGEYCEPFEEDLSRGKHAQDCVLFNLWKEIKESENAN